MFDKSKVQSRLAKGITAVLESPSCAFADGEVQIMLGEKVFRNTPKKKKKDEE